MFLYRLRHPLNQFMITAALALPKWIHSRWISCVLINRTIGRDDLPPANRTRPSACGSLLDVDVSQQALVVHSILRWSAEFLINRICDDEKPVQRLYRTLRPSAPTTPALLCSDSWQIGCFARLRRGTSHTGRLPSATPRRSTRSRPRLPTPNAVKIFSHRSFPKILMLFRGWLGRRWRTKVPGAKTVREKDQQHKADANDQGRHNRQNQVQALESQVHEVSHDERRLNYRSAH